MANIRSFDFCNRNTITPYVPTSISSYLAVSHSLSPYVTVYPWSAAGFGTKYSNPASPLPNTGRGVTFTSPADAIIIGHDTSPYITAYRWSAAGFGTKYTDVAVPPAAVNGMTYVNFNHSNNVIVSSFNNFGTPPCTYAHAWNNTTGFGAKFANPSTSPGTIGNGESAFNPDDTVLAVCSDTTPYVHAYAWNNTTGFGSKYANPSSLPPNAIYSVRFNAAGNAVACAGAVTPLVVVYNWSAGFGAKYTAPVTLPAIATLTNLKFTPDDRALVIGGGATQFIEAYKWNNTTGFGIKYSNPAVLPTGVVNGLTISAAGDFIAVAHTTTPFITVYAWNVNTGFGTKQTNPVTPPSANGTSAAFGNTLL